MQYIFKTLPERENSWSQQGLHHIIMIAHDSTDNDTNVSLAWIGLGFISGKDYTDLNDIIFHQSFNTLAILDCSIMTADWEFYNIQKLVINSSKFGRVKTCPTLYILLAFRFTFSNNTISDCSTDKSILHLQPNPQNSSYLTIVNCTFTELKGIKRREVATTSNPKNFTLQQDSKLISVEAWRLFILSINSSRFTDNKYLILVSLISDFDLDHTSVKLNVYDTIMRNNLATSVLVEGIPLFVTLDLTQNIDIILPHLSN